MNILKQASPVQLFVSRVRLCRWLFHWVLAALLVFTQTAYAIDTHLTMAPYLGNSQHSHQHQNMASPHKTAFRYCTSHFLCSLHKASYYTHFKGISLHRMVEVPAPDTYYPPLVLIFTDHLISPALPPPIAVLF